jgi:hypothetical protein
MTLSFIMAAVSFGLSWCGSAVQQDPGYQCWRFQAPQIACSGCGDAFNCGNCNQAGTGCNALIYQTCARVRPIVPDSNGVTVYQEEVACYTQYLCGIPPGCSNNPCTASGVQFAESEERTQITKTGFQCP